jgi:hypothetical protein
MQLLENGEKQKKCLFDQGKSLLGLSPDLGKFQS